MEKQNSTTMRLKFATITLHIANLKTRYSQTVSVVLKFEVKFESLIKLHYIKIKKAHASESFLFIYKAPQSFRAVKVLL